MLDKMKHTRIISLSHRVFLSDLDDIVSSSREKEFKYVFLPVIATSEKRFGDSEIIDLGTQSPPIFLSLYESQIPIESLIRYIGTIKKEELSVAKRALTMLNNFALQCSERVIADLFCQIIRKMRIKYNKDPLVFFIEKLTSDKLLGYLGYLFLDLQNITICFISYMPQDMVTTVMSAKTGKLLFDVHRLMSGSEIPIPTTSVYPGSSEDSLVQTFFFKPKSSSSSIEFFPIRVDMFCQGLLEPDIEEKKQIVQNILLDREESPPYPIKKRDPSPYVRLPLGFQHVLKSWDLESRQKKFFFESIKEQSENI